MQKLNDREKRLLTIVGGGMFLFANILGFIWLLDAKARQEREKGRIAGRIQQLKTWSNFSGEALSVEEYVAANLPPDMDEGIRETKLGDFVQGGLIDGSSVEVTKYQRLPTKNEGRFFDKTRYTATIEGEWTEVMDVIYRLQSPKDFRFVTDISMMPRKNESEDSQQNAQITVELEQWWPKKDAYAEESLTSVEQPAESTVENSSPAAPQESPEGTTAPELPKPAETPAAPTETPAAPAETPDATPPANSNPASTPNTP
jgi:Type II secretion system (T2SS), protein M subtype b